MWEMFAIGTVMLGLVFGMVVGFGQRDKSAPVHKPTVSQERRAMQEGLKRISVYPPSDEDINGAMCYVPDYDWNKVEYVCPVCGYKSVYIDIQMVYIDTYIPKLRDMVKHFPQTNILLDEKEYCQSCSPSVTNPKVYLMIPEGEKRFRRVPVLCQRDMEIIDMILRGSNIQKIEKNPTDSRLRYLIKLEAMIRGKTE